MEEFKDLEAAVEKHLRPSREQVGNSTPKVETTSTNQNETSEFDAQVDRCLAAVLHHPEVQEIAEVIKRVHRARENGHGRADI